MSSPLQWSLIEPLGSTLQHLLRNSPSLPFQNTGAYTVVWSSLVCLFIYFFFWKRIIYMIHPGILFLFYMWLGDSGSSQCPSWLLPLLKLHLKAELLWFIHKYMLFYYTRFIKCHFDSFTPIHKIISFFLPYHLSFLTVASVKTVHLDLGPRLLNSFSPDCLSNILISLISPLINLYSFSCDHLINISSFINAHHPHLK